MIISLTFSRQNIFSPGQGRDILDGSSVSYLDLTPLELPDLGDTDLDEGDRPPPTLVALGDPTAYMTKQQKK